MKKYSKANSIAHWRASLGKQEARKRRRPALSFPQLQSYVEKEGITAPTQSQMSRDTVPRLSRYQFNFLTLLGILLMFSQKVGANRRNNLGFPHSLPISQSRNRNLGYQIPTTFENRNRNLEHQIPPTSQGLIKQYWQNKYDENSPVSNLREKPEQVSSIEDFSPLATMPATFLQQWPNSGFRTPPRTAAEVKEESLYQVEELIYSMVLQPPLHKACQENDIEALRKLLSKGADFTLRNWEGKTVFDLACEQDALAMVRLLLEFGYNPEIPVENNIAPGIPVTNLFLAVHHDNYKLAHILLKYGRARSFPLLLEIAERNNNPKMRELLQSYLSKPPRKPSDLVGVSTVAEESTVQFHGRETFNQVNQKIFDLSDKVQTEGFYIQPQRRNYGTCIYETYRDEEGQLKSEHWTFSNSESYEFCLAILLESYDDVVRLFVTVDRNYPLPRGYNWMILSAVSDDPRIPNFFLHKGFDVNYRTVTGETVLHTLAANSHSRSIPNYIAAGANINAQDNQGRTPLMSAIFNRNLQQAKELIAGGANLSIRDKKGRDVRTIAFEHGCLKELNEILLSLGKKPLVMQPQTVSSKKADTSHVKDKEESSWVSQGGALLVGALIPILILEILAYFEQRPQPTPETPVKPREKAVTVASNKEVVPPELMNGRDIEVLRKKIVFSLEGVKSYLALETRDAYQEQQSEISLKQTRALNTLARLRKKARSGGMAIRYEDLFSRIDKDIILLVDFNDALSMALAEQNREIYDRLMTDIQNPELTYESLEGLSEQVKILSQKIEEENNFLLEKKARAQKALKRIDKNLDDVESQIAAPEEKRQQAFFKQQQEEIKQKAEQEQKELDKKKWQEEKKQRKLSKMEEMKKSKEEEKKKEKKYSERKRKGKEPVAKKMKKWEPYLDALRSDVDLLENILDADKINLYLADPKILLQCQFYGSCYYVMRIFHRLSKMNKFGLGNYAPCSADEAMQMRNAIMHQYETWFSNPEQMIAIAREVVRKLRHTCDALSRGEPAQQMDISIRLPENIGYSRIKILDRLYEDYLKVSEEAVRLALEGKYDFSQPFHGILKAFNFMLGQVLKDFNIRDNPFAAHRNDIGHRFDTDVEAEDGKGLSEEVNRWVLFELCKAPVMQHLAILVNECQQRAGVNLALDSQGAASSSSQSSSNAGEFPRFFAYQEGSGSSAMQSSSSITHRPRASKH